MVSFRNFPRRSDRRSSICMIALAAAALFAGSDEAVAYKLNMEGGCDPAPGQRWDISKGPVQVRLLAESLSDYVQKRGPAAPFDIRWIDDDIKAVIEAYNSIPGSGLVLELGPGILGDRNLEEPEDDNYGEQTIVIGFTDEVSPSSNTSEAWAPGADADDCTRTRAHILFRKTDNNGVPYNWVFGPPDDTDVNGRSFSTIAQPLLAGSSQPITFLGILTHEMGHAVGLGHPSDDYAIMAQNFDTWFRGRDNVLRTRLLPDDAAGLLALYGVREARNHLDLSVTNSWYQPGGGRMDCSDEQAMIDGLERMVAELGSVPGSRRLLKGLNETLLDLEDTLQTCLDTVSGAATQSRNCLVSSRGDEWIDRAQGAVFCGVNAVRNSAYPPVGDRVCPGGHLQLRYTLNNHSMFRDVLARAEVWLSATTELIARPNQALKSPDVRDFTVRAGDSNTIGEVFRLPGDARDGATYRVFVRAIPHEPDTGAALWSSDADQWNNAIMIRSAITVDSRAC
jgi:hypothetical protein